MLALSQSQRIFPNETTNLLAIKHHEQQSGNRNEIGTTLNSHSSGFLRENGHSNELSETIQSVKIRSGVAILEYLQGYHKFTLTQFYRKLK